MIKVREVKKAKPKQAIYSVQDKVAMTDFRFKLRLISDICRKRDAYPKVEP